MTVSRTYCRTHDNSHLSHSNANLCFCTHSYSDRTGVIFIRKSETLFSDSLPLNKLLLNIEKYKSDPE